MARAKTTLMSKTLGKISPRFLDEITRDFSKKYGEHVLANQAIPDLRDGLKPVQRRITWGMHQMGLGPASKFVKSAKVTGNVTGNYHPHGTCLDGKTLVHLLNGRLIPIEKLVGGEPQWVLSFDEKQDQVVPALAKAWRIGCTTDKTFIIHLSDGSTLETTSEHLIYVFEKGWTQAQDLQEYDKIFNIRATQASRFSKPSINSTKIFENENFNIYTDPNFDFISDDLSFFYRVKSFIKKLLKPKAIEPCFVTGIEKVNLIKHKYMYDFTVEKYENMFVCTNKATKNLILVHNSSVYGAMVNMAQKFSSVPIVQGQGNWGNFAFGPAAERYTECRLTAFGQQNFCDSNYLPCVEYTETFDGTDKEPLVLPSKVPYILLNGAEGIAYGTKTTIPVFALSGLLQLCQLALKRKITPQDCLKHLKFQYCDGGVCIATQQELLEFYRTGRGSIKFTGKVEKDLKSKTYTITGLPPYFNYENFHRKCSEHELVKSCDNRSSRINPICILVRGRDSLNAQETEACFSALDKILACQLGYLVNVVTRTQDSYQFMQLNIPQVIEKWIDYRVNLEKASLTYQISQLDLQIKRLELLILASDKLDIIFKILKTKHSDRSALAQALAQALKITLEQSKELLALAIGRLSRLEQIELQAKLQETIASRKILVKKLAQPQESVRLDLIKIGQLGVS